MNVSPEQRAELIKLRLENARETLEDARLMCDAGSLRSAINRAYYAMFYAVSALALSRGLSFSKHSGLISFFQREYVKASVLDQKHGRALQKAFEDRSEADYQDYLRLTREQVKTRLNEAEDLIHAIESHLNVV